MLGDPTKKCCACFNVCYCTVYMQTSLVLDLTVILRGRAGYELIYITNEAVGLVWLLSAHIRQVREE